MATTVEPRAASETDAPRFLFHDVSWDDYEAMLRIVGDRHIRVTYDQGEMEIMSPTHGHDRFTCLLVRFVDAITDELEMPVIPGGTNTLKHPDLFKGAQPDACFWFRENTARIVAKRRLEMPRDPAPDLIIEVDVTSSSLNRFGIFAAMGIPEVWRLEGDSLEFLHLDAGTYHSETSSRNFPALTTSDVSGFLARATTTDAMSLMKAFRDFVRDDLIKRLP